MTDKCWWCQGSVPKGKPFCSDVCEKIGSGTHWPHQSGPVTHEDIQGWINEQNEIDRLVAERQAK